MRTRLLSALLLVAAGLPALAQITITAADNLPAVGDTFLYNTAAYAAPPAGGDDVTFDYSALTTTGTTEFHWLAPSAYSGAAAFPNADLAATNELDTFLYEVTGVGLERVAEHQHIVIPFPPTVIDLDVAHSNSILDLPLPLSNDDVWSDPLEGTVTSDGSTGTRTGLVQGEADAYGYILLPGGGAPVPVLRVRTNLQETIQIPIGNQMTPVSHKRMQHDYYAPWLKMPILSVFTDTLNAGLTVTESGIRYLASAPVGLAEHMAADQGFGLFPNPMNDVVTITFSSAPGTGALLEVLDALGRTVRSERMGNRTWLSLSLAGEEPGCYFVRLTDTQGRMTTQRLIKR